MKPADIRRLHQKKYREESGCFLIEGEHLVQELEKAAVRDARLRTSEIYLTAEYAHWQSQLGMHVINSRHMQQISETQTPQGIAAVDLRGEPISAPAFREFQCYVYGSEARGVPREALDSMGARSFTIAGAGRAESLNVAAAVTICQYELHRRGS